MTGILPNTCPCCHQNTLIVKDVFCEKCGTTLSGSFISPFNQFTDDEQVFIKIFIQKSGSLKSVAQLMNKSYPTIRKMLNQIINKIE